jgi:hypothetical protein
VIRRIDTVAIGIVVAAACTILVHPVVPDLGCTWVAGTIGVQTIRIVQDMTVGL